MDEELPPIHISADDIAEANRLSLNCPICAGAVENNVNNDALTPVVCGRCQTLYHRACWGQNGSKCAILGCGHNQSYVYGSNNIRPLQIKYTDLPKDPSPRPSIPVNGRVKQLKEQEQKMQREMKRRTFWGDLWQSLLRSIGIWRQ